MQKKRPENAFLTIIVNYRKIVQKNKLCYSRRILLKPRARPWTRTLDLDPEKPGPKKTWTQKNLHPENPGPRKTWTLKILDPENLDPEESEL